MSDRIAVVIPTIPPRRQLLARALNSVTTQSVPAAFVSIAIDSDHDGAPVTRQRALAAVDAARYPWVAFLDDDDEWFPEHLAKLHAFAVAGGYDYAYSWFWVVAAGGRQLAYDPVFPPTHYTQPWDPANPRQTTITTLVRTELAQAAGFLPPAEGAEIAGQRAGEDWDFTLRCNELGRIGHLVDHTWLWHHDPPGGNTSGMGSRW